MKAPLEVLQLNAATITGSLVNPLRLCEPTFYSVRADEFSKGGLGLGRNLSFRASVFLRSEEPGRAARSGAQRLIKRPRHDKTRGLARILLKFNWGQARHRRHRPFECCAAFIAHSSGRNIIAINSFDGPFATVANQTFMADKPLKRYLFASDFDQTLTFNDSGYVLAELVGIPVEEFERKAKGMAKINLVQQGAELAYLLLHDPEFQAKVRKEHLREVGKRIRLKGDIKLLYQILATGVDGHFFDFYVLSAAPVEVIHSALEGIVPPDHIFGTEFRYKPSGEIDSIIRATAGYGKVAVLNQLLAQLVMGPDHVVYSGDGSSDIHIMLQLNARDGLTIAVSESPHVSQIAKRTVLSTSALAVLAPILEEIAGWDHARIRSFFEANGMLIQEWERVRTDWLTLRPAIPELSDPVGVE
jgi:phosphoserine phosphatase